MTCCLPARVASSVLQTYADPCCNAGSKTACDSLPVIARTSIHSPGSKVAKMHPPASNAVGEETQSRSDCSAYENIKDELAVMSPDETLQRSQSLVCDCETHSTESASVAGKLSLLPQKSIFSSQRQQQQQEHQVCDESVPPPDDGDDEPSSTTSAIDDVYNKMLSHLEETQPPIVGIRFEMLLDGFPDYLGQKSESQLHVVVVRQVSRCWKYWFQCFRLVVLLALTTFMLYCVFGPISSIIAIFLLLNDQQIAQNIAIGQEKEARELQEPVDCSEKEDGNAPGSTICEHDDDIKATYVSYVSWFCFFVLNFLNDDEFSILMLQRFFGTVLIFMAYTCKGGMKSFEQKQSFQARSILATLSLQFFVAQSVVYMLSADSWLLFLLKWIIIILCVLMVHSRPVAFYFFCADYFSISEFPKFQEPLLFVFGTKDITKVLKIRFAIRNQSEEVLKKHKITHVLPCHIDSVSVGHITTERLASVFVLPIFYNSHRYRKLLYVTYTYLLPIMNCLHILVFPSDALSRVISHICGSFKNDFLINVLMLAHAVVQGVFFLFGASLLINFCTPLFNMFEYFAQNAEKMSTFISQFDQSVAYFAHRLGPLKQVCDVIFRMTQPLGSIACKAIASLNFTKWLTIMTHARILSGTAGNVDLIGRMARSQSFRCRFGKWKGKNKVT